MGLFGSSKKVFSTHKEIKKRLFEMRSLTQEQRELVYNEVVKELEDGGGVTEFEWEKRLRPIFWRMVKEGKIGETDYDNLKKLSDS